jgi:hypothetical protein
VTPGSVSRDEPDLLQTLGQDAQYVWTDVRRIGLVQSVKRTLSDLQKFYLSAHNRERLGAMPRVRRAIYLVAWLLKSLFLKLTPTRRVLFAVSLFLMIQSATVLRVSDQLQVVIRFPFVGFTLLLLILMLELKDKLVARNELEAGRAVQLALMPQSSPAISGWDLWLFTRSANDVGGDLVDYMQLGDQRFGVVLGDVAGKGLPAALLMSKLQATLRALASEETSLGALGSKMNRILCRDGLANRFATLVYMEIGPQSGCVRLLNAGHMPPFIIRAAALEELPRGAMALGMLPDANFSEHAFSLNLGDVLVVFSDGLTDAMNASGDFFGEERLRDQLAALAGLTPKQIGTQVVAAVDAFVGDQPPHDDLSLTILMRTGTA